MAVLETEWLRVGHVDEYLSICPNPKAARGYTLIKANPRLALRLLRETPDEEIARIPEWEYRDRLAKVKKFLLAHRLEIGEDDRRLPPALSASEPSDDAEIAQFIKTNLVIADLIDANVKRDCDKISEVRGEPGRLHSVISFPSLFYKSRGSKHSAYLPGSVNQLILYGNLFTPDPLLESFRRNMRRTVEKVGLRLHFVDALPYHRAYGQIHCATNVFRHPSRCFVPPR